MSINDSFACTLFWPAGDIARLYINRELMVTSNFTLRITQARLLGLCRLCNLCSTSVQDKNLISKRVPVFTLFQTSELVPYVVGSWK